MLLSERLSRAEKILDERAGRSPSPLSSDDECLEEFQRRQERSRSRARPRSKIPPVAPHDQGGWQPSPGAVAWVKEVTMNGQSLWIRARQDRRAGLGSIGAFTRPRAATAARGQSQQQRRPRPPAAAPRAASTAAAASSRSSGARSGRSTARLPRGGRAASSAAPRSHLWTNAVECEYVHVTKYRCHRSSQSDAPLSHPFQSRGPRR